MADLPGLVVAAGDDPLQAWVRRFPTAPKEAYVRFPRGGAGDVPLGAVQRLARRALVTVDAHPRDPDDVLDLAVAGAHAVVAWMHEGGDIRSMAEAMGDGFLLAAQAGQLEAACAIARDLDVPLLVEGSPAPEGLHGYLVDLSEEPVLLRQFGDWPHEAPVGPEQADQADADGPAAASGDDDPADETAPDATARSRTAEGT